MYSSLPQLCQELYPLTNWNKLYTSVLFLNLKIKLNQLLKKKKVADEKIKSGHTFYYSLVICW